MSDAADLETPGRVSEGTPLGSMPMLSIIGSGPSLWLLSDGFCSEVIVFMASVQKDVLLVRTALVPVVALIIIHTPTNKVIKSHQFHNK